jgi:hypothetical protein
VPPLENATVALGSLPIRPAPFFLGIPPSPAQFHVIGEVGPIGHLQPQAEHEALAVDFIEILE